MNNKLLIMSILLIFVVLFSSSSVFAEDALNADELQQVDDVDTISEIEMTDEKLSAERTVNAGSTGQDIQDAIDSMNDGDVLNLENGTYTDVCVYINKSITINGNGATLVGYDNPSVNTTPSIITNTSANGGYGIANLAALYIVKADNVTVNGLTIIAGANNTAYSNALVYVESSNNLKFEENILDGSSWGLYLRFSNDAKIIENQIKNQAVTGILSFGSARTQIERNKVINAANHGIDVRHGTGPNVQVINNTIVGSKEGIYLMHSQGHTAAENTIVNCTISSISCYGSSNIQLYNNTMKKSRIGVLLGGGYDNITIGTNTFALDNLPYPPTFVYYVAEGKTDYSSATKMMGTHSDSSSYSPTYVEYSEIPTPKDISIDYTAILKPTGTTYNVLNGTSSENIQKMIASLNDGDTLEFEENGVYENISIYVDKNVKIIGNNATLIGYDNLDLANVPEKITATSANNGYAISERAVLYVINNTGAVVSNLNIIAKFPGYNPNAVVGPTTIEYKTAGIRTQDSKNITITNCKIDGASWGIYMEYSTNAIVTNNEISNQYTTGILNFGTGYSILANNKITNAVNHGIDVRHGTGPSVTVFNNTISGSKEGIYLMHSQGHNVYNNTITNAKLTGITCYGSGNENVFNNSISGSRIGILLGGGYYNVTIGENKYTLDSLPFPPTFVTYLVKAENKYGSASNVIGTYSDKNDVNIEATDIANSEGEFNYTVTLTDGNNNGVAKQSISLSVNNENYTAVTDNDGIAVFTLNLNKGTYNATITYAGTDNYNSAATNATITISENKVPKTSDAKSIQEAIDSASEGDIIDLSLFDLYDVGNTTIEVGVKGITLKGNNTIINGWGGPGNGIFHVTANDVTFQGIIFNDTNPNSVLTYYDDATKNAHQVSGWGIHFQRASNGVVDDCVFINFNHGVRVQQQSNNVTIMNSVFTGVTNYLRNDPTVNVEKGTKAIGVMGSQNTKIINNTFNGPMLDAVSLASGCGGAQVTGNTFVENSYAIYFGGASTGGTLIENNTFIKCGSYSELDNNNQTVTWEELPVISIQKSAAGLQIINNNFEAINNNVLIAAEAGNTAHGYPSEIGNINVTGNKVTKFSDDVVAESVTLLHILSRGGDLNPTGPIDVSGNTFTGAVKALVFWNTEWGSEKGNVSDIVIPKGNLAPTVIAVTTIDKDGNVTAVLKDINGNPIAGEVITYAIDGGNATEIETDENGQVVIAGEAGKTIVLNFAETSSLAASDANITLPESAAGELIGTTIEADATFTRVTNDYNAGERGEKFYAILKDANGNPLVNKTCFVAVNGPIYNVTTDDQGRFGIGVNFAAANTYTYALSFLGDDQYAASFNCSKLIMKTKKTSITASAKTFKASAKTKSISVTLKTVKNPYDGKTYLSSGKKLTLKVNGKTYTAKTNAKGVAKFTIQLTKKGTYTAKISFAGDKTYSASNKSVKVTIK